MRTLTRHFLAAAIGMPLLSIGSGLASQAAAQNFPSKTVVIVVPSPPGGVTDVLARALSVELSAKWAQPVIVENKSGASQMVGTLLVVKSAPDGYTLLLAGADAVTSNPHLYPRMPYDALNDLAPVANVGSASPVIAVNAATPATTLQELVALVRSQPGKFSYGSSGNGTYAHVGMEKFKQLSKTFIVHVPYHGTAQIVQDMLGNQIQMTLTNASVVQPYVNSGQVRMLAAAGPRRLAQYPAMPTVAESGFPGFSAGTWWAVMAPAKTPAPLLEKINAEIRTALRSPAFRQRTLTQLGLEAPDFGLAEVAALVRSDHERIGKSIRETGIKAD